MELVKSSVDNQRKQIYDELYRMAPSWREQVSDTKLMYVRQRLDFKSEEEVVEDHGAKNLVGMLILS